LPSRLGTLAKAPWYRPFVRALRAAAYLVAHAMLALLLIAAISVIQRALIRTGDPKLFDFLPERYMFDSVDIAIFAISLVYGIVDAIKAFSENDDE